MRILLFAVLLVTAARAQDAPAHALPFGSGGHTLELALGGDATNSGGALTVAVESAPAWLTFDQAQAMATTNEPEPVARLTFAAARTAPVGTPGEIWLVVRDAAGAVVAEKTVRVEVSAPAELSVEPPRPNPSRGAVTVPYALPASGRVRVVVVDGLGREVLVLVDGEASAGGHEARIPAGRLAAGVYAVRVAAGGREARPVRVTVVR